MKALKEYQLNIRESEDQNISEEMKALKENGLNIMKAKLKTFQRKQRL
jgi:hypothetical protein